MEDEERDRMASPPDRSEALRLVAEALNETVDAEAALAALLPHLGTVLGLRTAWAFRWDPERETFVEVAATGLPPALAEDGERALREGSCECQRRFRQGLLRRPVNMVRCSRLAAARGDRGGLVVHASVPLRSKGKPLGILNVAAPGRAAFDRQALTLLSAVGHQVAAALDRAALYARERRRGEQLAALSDIGRTLVAYEDEGALLADAVRLGVTALGFPRLALFKRTDGGAAVVAAEGGIPRTAEGARRPVRGGSRLAESVGDGEFSLVAESPRPDAFDDLDASLLSAYAAHLGTALANVRRQQAARRAAAVLERQRIAADLHDMVSQRLFAAELSARAAALHLPTDPAAAAAALAQTEAGLKEAQAEMRMLVTTLRSGPDIDLAAALADSLRPLRTHAPARVRLSLTRAPLQLPPRARWALLRLAEEAVHNALRHSQAGTVRVTLRRRPQAVVLTVADDGIGFDPATVRRGQGLANMAARAAEAGGVLRVASRPGCGTTVAVTVPTAEGPPCPR
jgi:signal transduction histidine kinase